MVKRAHDEAPMGRPPRAIPRRQRHCYMAEDTISAVKRYQSDAVARGEACSFSDAVEQMIEVATAVKAKPRFIAADKALEHLTGALAPAWIAIDANNGRHVRCNVCDETYDVPSNRFSGYLKGIGTFIEAHRDCGNGKAEEKEDA